MCRSSLCISASRVKSRIFCVMRYSLPPARANSTTMLSLSSRRFGRQMYDMLVGRPVIAMNCMIVSIASSSSPSRCRQGNALGFSHRGDSSVGVLALTKHSGNLIDHMIKVLYLIRFRKSDKSTYPGVDVCNIHFKILCNIDIHNIFPEDDL